MYSLLITGAGGLLGSNLAFLLHDRFAVTATFRGQPPQLDLCETTRMDITDEQNVQAVFARVHPDIVIHCAAETDVDGLETTPQDAFRTNVCGTGNLSLAARAGRAKLIYVSTDGIFDGRSGMYAEDAAPAPLNIYAWSKLTAESVVSGLLDDFIVARTNFFGWNATTRVHLAEWIIQRLADGLPVPAFQDVVFSPLLVNDLAEILYGMIQRNLMGFYHVGASDSCSKLAFATMLCETFGFDRQLIRPTSVAEANLKAARPKNTSLDSRRTVAALGRPMPSVADAVRRFRRLLDDGYTSALRSVYRGMQQTSCVD